MYYLNVVGLKYMLLYKIKAYLILQKVLYYESNWFDAIIHPPG